MRGDVPGVAWPPLHSTRSASLAALVLQLDRSQWSDPVAIAAGQRRQLAGLGAHFARHSPAFAARLKGAGLDARDFADFFHLLPPVSRRDVQRDSGAVAAALLPEGHAPAFELQTSGSTGEPVKVMKTAVSQFFWAALTLRYHLWQEPDFRGRLCAIRALMANPGETQTWGSPFADLFDTGASLRIDNGTDLAVQIEALERFRPTSLMIYPTNLAAMLDRLEGRGLAGLERVRTIGETLSPDLRTRVAGELGATVRDCYSSEEFGYIAFECPDGGLYHIMSETLLVELLDEDGRPCGEGETGRLVITDLHNHATPMIRYAIGDIAEAGPPCPCGRGLPTLRRIVGRERNMVVLPGGATHWPITGFKRFRDIAPVVQYQIVQHSLHEVEVRLVVEQRLTPEQEAALADRIGEYLGHRFAARFTYFADRLPPAANGKFEEFVCLVRQ